MSTVMTGVMIVGARGSELEVPEDFEGDIADWAEFKGMDKAAPWGEADPDDCFYGFIADDVLVDHILVDPDGKAWLAIVREYGKMFKHTTGVDAKLIGTADIY